MRWDTTGRSAFFSGISDLMLPGPGVSASGETPVARTLTGATKGSPDKVFHAVSRTFQTVHYTNALLKPDHRMLFVRGFHFGDLLWFQRQIYGL